MDTSILIYESYRRWRNVYDCLPWKTGKGYISDGAGVGNSPQKSTGENVLL